MKTLLTAFILVALIGPAAQAKPSAEDIARRVGQVFAGYDDFWVWVTQQFQDPNGRVATYRGRAYFKRDKMFRLNFGQPPFLIEGTDGKDYWVYEREKNEVRITDLDEKRDPHPLLMVFAAGDQMVRALNRFFDVDALEEVDYTVPASDDAKDAEPVIIPAYKLVISLKPEKLKEMREQSDNKLVDDRAKQVWTFWIDRKKSIPLCIEFDWESGARYKFVLGRFYNNVDLQTQIFRIPRPQGVRVIRTKPN
jgi:outer membrane lipoprotein-sorting protein